MKLIKSICLDAQDLEEFRQKLPEKYDNLSKYFQDCMRTELEYYTKSRPDLLEKQLFEQENDLKKQLSSIEIEKNTLETRKKMAEEAEKLKKDEEFARKNRLIAQELRWWPTIIKRGYLSTQSKREKYFDQRAKIIGISTGEYIEKVVSVAEEAQKT